MNEHREIYAVVLLFRKLTNRLLANNSLNSEFTNNQNNKLRLRTEDIIQQILLTYTRRHTRNTVLKAWART